MSALPTFLVIGAMKAGTYSLHNYLDLHPAIEMSRKRKEVNFFVKELNWRHGLDWYRKHFRGHTLMRGESSTRYSMMDRHRGVPERIKKVLPNARLVYVVRDPIRRLQSQYVHEYDDYQEHRSFDEMLRAEDRHLALNSGLYYRQLQAYLKHFPADAIKVVCFEELAAKPVETMQSVLEFLEVDADFEHPAWSESHNDSADKRRETRAGRVVRKLVGRRRLRRIPWLRERFTRPIPKPEFDARRHADIVSMYREDADRLAQFAGRSFEHWTGVYNTVASQQKPRTRPTE